MMKTIDPASSKKMLKLLFLATTLSGAGAVFAQSPDMPGAWSEQKLEQQKTLQRPRSAENGDEAMQKGNFATAVSFYNEYRQEAKTLNDKDALKDAYECEINALIRSENVRGAEKTLAEFKKDFPAYRSPSIALWEANLLLFKKDPDGAIKTLRAVLQTLQTKNPHDPHRIHALTALATAYEIKKDYKSAAACYRALLKDSTQEINVQIKMRYVLALIANGDTTEAGKLLKEIDPGTNEQILEAHQLLSFYLAIRNKQEDLLGGNFSLSDEKTKVGSGSFFFMLASLIGDAYFNDGNFEKALDAYRLAFFYTKRDREGLDAMSRILFVFDSLKETDKAAALALKHFAFFMEPNTSTELKCKVALLLIKSGGNGAKALELFRRIFQESPREEKTFRNAFAYLLHQKRFTEASKLTDLFYDVKKRPETLGKALLCHANIADRANQKREAAELYVRAAEKNEKDYEKYMTRAITLYVNLRDHDQVIEKTGELLKRAPRSRTIFFRAESREIKKDLPGARQDYLTHAALEQVPVSGKSVSFFRAGAIAFKSEDFRAAAGDFRNALDLGIKNKKDKICVAVAPEAGYWLVSSHLAFNDTSGAGAAADLLAEHFSGSVYFSEAYLKMANHLETAGKQREAENWLIKLEKSNPSKSGAAETLYRKALLNFRSGNSGKTEELLNTVIREYEKIQPHVLADVYYLFGDLLKKDKKFADAIRKYEKARQFRPGSMLWQAATGSIGDCQFALASLSGKPETFSGAIGTYRELLAAPVQPEYELMTRYKLARSLELSGDRAGAESEYSKLLSARKTADWKRDPSQRFWVLKGLRALELLALKHGDIASIENVLGVMTELKNTPELKKENYSARIKRLRRMKKEKITAGK